MLTEFWILTSNSSKNQGLPRRSPRLHRLNHREGKEHREKFAPFDEIDRNFVWVVLQVDDLNDEEWKTSRPLNLGYYQLFK